MNSDYLNSKLYLYLYIYNSEQITFIWRKWESNVPKIKKYVWMTNKITMFIWNK